MKTQHTPGPWKNFGPIIHKNGQHIAALSKCGNFSIEDKANIQIMTTAPEMLETLQRLSEQARTFLQSDSFGLIKKKNFEKEAKNRLGAIIETAEEVIKKAKGYTPHNEVQL